MAPGAGGPGRAGKPEEPEQAVLDGKVPEDCGPAHGEDGWTGIAAHRADHGKTGVVSANGNRILQRYLLGLRSRCCYAYGSRIQSSEFDTAHRQRVSMTIFSRLLLQKSNSIPRAPVLV